MNFNFFKSIVISFWIFTLAIVFVSSLKTQIVLSEGMKTKLNTIFPEGWSFFTRNPREPLLESFNIVDNNLVPIPLSNSSSENFFGFSRKSRVKGFEASMIVSDIPSNIWKEDTGIDYKKHINDSVINIKPKQSNTYFKKGVYLFVLKKPIPWAWAGKNQEKYAPYSVAKVKVN